MFKHDLTYSQYSSIWNQAVPHDKIGAGDDFIRDYVITKFSAVDYTSTPFPCIEFEKESDLTWFLLNI